MKRRRGQGQIPQVNLSNELMFAPAVMALRMPLLALEARDMNPFAGETAIAWHEKLMAMAEGATAAQLSLARSMAGSWFDLAAGRVPSMLDGRALRDATEAALAPSGKRVSANFRRLSRPKA